MTVKLRKTIEHGSRRYNLGIPTKVAEMLGLENIDKLNLLVNLETKEIVLSGKTIKNED